MTFTVHSEARWLVLLYVLLSLSGLTVAVAAPVLLRAQGATAGGKEQVVHARGTFDVKLTPQALAAPDAVRGRMSMAKQFRGDLEGSSVGEMLTGGDVAKGSAGYVAIEQVTGTLGGRTGSFLLQHSATMARGAQSLSIVVVPDSGTGQLTGLSGRMTIDVGGGRHSYEFEYAIDPAGR